jgi:hypothetical protein
MSVLVPEDGQLPLSPCLLRLKRHPGLLYTSPALEEDLIDLLLRGDVPELVLECGGGLGSEEASLLISGGGCGCHIALGAL